jgi:hypothetical protein
MKRHVGQKHRRAHLDAQLHSTSVIHRLFHYGMQLLTMLELPLWKGAVASDMLRKALTLQAEETKQYEREWR